MLILVLKNVFDYAYVSPEIFLTSPPHPPPPPSLPRRQHFQEKFFRLGQNPRKCWSRHDDTPPPPPNVDGPRPWFENGAEKSQVAVAYETDIV